MSNLIAWVISQLEVAVNSKIKKKKQNLTILTLFSTWNIIEKMRY